MKDGIKQESSLKREIGLLTSTLLVVGLLVGSGIFKKIVPMSQSGLSETAIILAWVAAGIISLLGAFSAGGLASLTEESGGTYEYFRLSFGKFLSFLSGWADFMVIGTGASAAIAFLFAQTINSVVPLPDPLHSLDNISIGNFIFPFADSGLKIVGIVTMIVLTLINSLGARESGTVNNIITTIKILGILGLIYLGLSSPPMQPDQGIIQTNVVSPRGIFFLSAFISIMLEALWAYERWVYAANISGEMINPKKNLPLALAFGILITMVIYVLVNYVFLHLMPPSLIKNIGINQIGAVVILEPLLGSYGRVLLLVLIAICALGALNSNVISLPRKYFRMAQEGYFFSRAKHVHKKFSTPTVSLIYSLVWSCLLLVSGTFEMLTNMVIFIGFIFYGMLCVALIKLKRNGTIKVKVTGYPVAPVIFLLFSIALTVNEIWNNPKQSLFGLLLVLSGIPFYFLFQRRNRLQ